jgi:hypothetical protein
MTRTIVTVGTGTFARGVDRLRSLAKDPVMAWTKQLPEDWPPHKDSPYAFKGFALEAARAQGAELVMWLDSAIKPIKPLDPIWDLIEQQGHWFASNWWSNNEWCCDAALPLLGATREELAGQMHIVAGAFGLNLKTENGAGFLDDYLRYAKNGAFRGPWSNEAKQASAVPGVLGHRHDQTAASLIVHRRGMKWSTTPPVWLAYAGHETEETILLVERCS